jgi:predicted metalloendopeptidase
MKAYVTTIIRQEIEVPEGWERDDVYEFLAEHQSFNDAFQGVSNEDQTARIVNVMVVEEEITELGEESYDA